MTGTERRLDILKTMEESQSPLSGCALAEKYHVSRQVIVQDIALLRAADYSIASTNRGYLIRRQEHVTRVFCVYHTGEQMEDELNTIVDMGGKVRDVFIDHAIYGHLDAKLNICSRRNVSQFMDEIKKGDSRPLTDLTAGVHYHTVEAESQEVLDIIEEELMKKGYIKQA